MKTYNLVYKDEKQLEKFIKDSKISLNWEILLQVFCGIVDSDYIKNLQKIISKYIPNANVIWTTTAWEIFQWKVFDKSVVFSISVFDKSKVNSWIVEIMPGDEFIKGKDLAQQISRKDTKVIILFSDSIWINWEEVMRWVSSFNSNTIIAWGESWDNYLFKKSYVFDNNKIISNWAVAASLNSNDLIVSNDYNFDWITVGKFLEVTKAEWNRLYEIDNIPVHYLYREYLWTKIENQLPESWIEFPIVIDRDWVKLARAVLQVNDDGSIWLAGNIKVWDKIQFWYWHKAEILNSSYKIFNRVKSNPIESIFIYSCCARKKYLGKDIEKEIINFNSLWDVSWFFTYWEYFYTKSWSEFMNETMTILWLSENNKIKNLKDKKSEYEGKLYDSTVYALTHLIRKTSEELTSVNEVLKWKIDDNMKEISEKDKRYRAIVEDQTELVCRYLPDWTYTFINKAFCRFFRTNYETVVWSRFVMNIPDEDLLIVNKKNFSLNTQNSSQTIEHRIIMDTWEIRWLQWTDHALFDESWTIVEYQSVWRDITERKIMQEKYEKSKAEYFALYKTIIDNMEEIVWIWDKNKNTVYANTKYCQITWYKLNEIKWKDFYSLWDDKIVKRVKKINSESAKTSRYQWEWVLISKSWKLIPVFMNKVPFLDGWIVLIMQDLTDLKKIQKRAQHLNELNSLKTEFVSIVSHELRTPMTSIKWYVSMLLDEDYWSINPEAKDVLETIYTSTQRLINMINDMLDLSKLDAWKMVFNRELFGFKWLIDDIYSEYLNSAQEKNLEFSIKWVSTDIVLNTDKDKLRQVIVNLISNAFKFTPAWWTVTIVWKKDKEEKNMLLCEVIDTWVWIDPKDFKKVFWKFQQVHSHLVRQQAWTWLWIPISQKLLKKMWWNLYLDSEVWKGAKFYFKIPIYLQD